MPRMLIFLAVAAFLFMLVGVAAAILKLAAALVLAAIGGVAILAVAVWLLVRGATGASAAR